MQTFGRVNGRLKHWWCQNQSIGHGWSNNKIYSVLAYCNSLMKWNFEICFYKEKCAKFSIFINIITWLKSFEFQLYKKKIPFTISYLLILSHQVLTHTNIFMRYIDAIMHRIILGSPRNSLHQRNFLFRYVWRKVFNCVQNIDKFSFHSCL